MLVVLTEIGAKQKLLVEKLSNCLEKCKTLDRPIKTDAVRITFMSLLGVILFFFVPAAIFQAIENWTYGESAYYAFVSLTTIGFGDYVAGKCYYLQ